MGVSERQVTEKSGLDGNIKGGMNVTEKSGTQNMNESVIKMGMRQVTEKSGQEGKLKAAENNVTEKSGKGRHIR